MALTRLPGLDDPAADSAVAAAAARAYNDLDADAKVVMDAFHPAVRTWFLSRFPLGPTPPQLDAWPSIRRGDDTLVAAPTGSGKTLSAFLVAIDELYKRHEAGTLAPDTAQVVYVSPLKALAVDIQENLEGPLGEIAALASTMGLAAPSLRVGVRSGDTTSSQRSTMIRRPPQFIVTTPESLYLLLTAERSRDMLRTVNTVIVDEIHAVARDKRGSHLALTLERLDHVCGAPPTRIGLSATQRPIETVAKLLVGAGRCDPDGSPRCTIVDTGHQRKLDLALELPESELEALAPAEQMGELLDRIADFVNEHHTTLVFVNTRRLAERTAHQLAERLGDSEVAAHHGSLSKERRYRIERKLRAGEFKALVATASLELGIDIGPVELVCQLGSPRSLNVFLQRVGRSGHSRHGTPKGRLFPTTRDELVECTALLAGVRAGHLDAIEPPYMPLDILIQQIVAETAAERWNLDELYALFRRAQPYAGLTRPEFDEAVAFASDGVMTGRGAKAAYMHVDSVNNEAEGRRGARLAALTSGGAIPEMADYRVVADPDDTFIGTVNEDWATESMPGDIFTLGTHSWRIRRIEPGVVRVIDADGLPPTIPVWFGEAPGRTPELSAEVGNLREMVQGYLRDDDPAGAANWLIDTAGIDAVAAEQIVHYLHASLVVLGALPTPDRIVIERFFDESGGMQLVVHAPFGARINRAFGLALRKKFCVNFDFELQAAANDNAVVLSLGPQHSFKLSDVPSYLSSNKLAQTVTQAVLVPPQPMFISRWRWNLNRSLTVLRFKAGRKNPPPIQRMESDDVMAALFPSAAGCQENVTGPLEIPDHIIVRQTMHDTLYEGMDVGRLRAIVERLETETIEVVTVDSTEPSPLAHELLVGAPYTFLDDAEAIDRRTRAVPLRRGLPIELDEIGAVDPEAIDRVHDEAQPDVRTADELHDLLSDLVRTPARVSWQPLFDELAAKNRVEAIPVDDGPPLWTTAESAHYAAVAGSSAHDAPDANVQVVRGHLDITGPVTVEELAALCALKPSTVKIALADLESQGFSIQGSWRRPSVGTEWCSRRLLSRIHVYSQKRKRKRVQSATAQDFVRFLLGWHHLAPGTQVRGRAGLVSVIEQLQGWEAPAGAWEAILADRVAGYRPELLDELCLSGEVVWGRLTLPTTTPDESAKPSRATPVALTTRSDLPWLLAAARGLPSTEATRSTAGGAAPGYTDTAGDTDTTDDAAMPDGAETNATDRPVSVQIADLLASRGAQFHTELASATGLRPADIENGLWAAVARGLVTADNFGAIRRLFDRREHSSRRRSLSRGGLRQGASGHTRGEGRWSLLPAPAEIEEPDHLAEAVAEQLLARWGVVFRDLVVGEALALPWRDILWALRRLEARGVVQGGRFVSGFGGEQFALPEAANDLRDVAKAPSGQVVTVRAVDPCNVTGSILPGSRIAAQGTATFTVVDGAVIDPTQGDVDHSADTPPTRPPASGVSKDPEDPR